MLKIKYYILLILFTWSCIHGKAQTPVLHLSAEDEFYSLGKYASLYIDSSTTLTFDEIRTTTYQGKFTPFESDALSLGVMPEAVWVKIQIQSEVAKREWLLCLDYPLFDYVTFFHPNETGEWERKETGDFFPFKNRVIENRNFVFSINPSSDSVSVFYLRFETSGSMQIHPQLYSQEKYLKEDTLSEMGFGIFYGGLFIILLYNLMMFFSLKDWAYGVYCFHLFASIFQQMALFGHSNQFIFNNGTYLTNMHVPFAMVLNVFTTGLFAIVFLKTKKFSPVWHKVLMVLVISCAIHMVAIFFMPLIKSIPFSGLLSTICLPLVLFAAISTYRKGNKSARFFLLAWMILIFSGSIAGLRLFGILPSHPITIHSVKFGMIMEALLMAFALADKYNLFKLEKEAAQEKVLKVQENANKTLESKVKARTLELAKTNDKLSLSLIKVEEERKKSDKLLLNILPAETAAELKEYGASAPKQYELATVLFTDFKNFTQLVENLSPAKIIEILGICFLAFDEICERNNIEKIKTIGDSYMAAGGLPIPNATNPIDAVKAALEIQEWMNNWDQSKYVIDHLKWELRIGIHSGPVMAGVVGKNKFAYDIWGDTVNIAWCMRSVRTVSSRARRVAVSLRFFLRRLLIDITKNTITCT